MQTNLVELVTKEEREQTERSKMVARRDLAVYRLLCDLVTINNDRSIRSVVAVILTNNGEHEVHKIIDEHDKLSIVGLIEMAKLGVIEQD